MSQYAIGTYVTFRDKEGVPTGLDLQNFHQGETRLFRGRSFLWASFGFSGSTVDLQGAAIAAQLVFAHSQLLLDTMKTASDLRWTAVVRTVWMDATTLAETTLYSREVFAVLGYEHDLRLVTVRLGSPLDAINEQMPRRVLSRRLVGALPSTGSIPLR